MFIIIILFGPPASGKGTQIKNLLQKFDISNVPVGDILRKNIQENTKLGLEIKNYVDNGKLVPDLLISKVVENFVKNIKLKKGLIFDGFPRNLPQCLCLDKILERNISEKKYIIINLKIHNPKIIINRIMNRFIKENRIDDKKKKLLKKG